MKLRTFLRDIEDKIAGFIAIIWPPIFIRYIGIFVFCYCKFFQEWK
jgi:hypothetical protein